MIADPAEIAELDALDVAPWTSDRGTCYFVIQIGVIPGRSLTNHKHRVAAPAC